MRIRLAVPEGKISQRILDAALEAATRTNEAILQDGATPVSKLIRSGRVVWRPERFKDGEHFDTVDLLARRKWGDCDDLAPALAAERRLKGDEEARAVSVPSGPNKWHAIVETGDGRVLDPSIAAGMLEWKKKHGGSLNGFEAQEPPTIRGASIMPLFVERAGLGLKRLPNRIWAARADLPAASGVPAAVCGVALDQDANDAVRQALEAAMLGGLQSGIVHPHDVRRAAVMEAALCGEDEDAIGDLLGLDEDEVGSIFDIVKKALPVASSFIPGGGLATGLASSLIPGGGGKKRGAAPPGQPFGPSPSGNIAAQGPDPSYQPHVLYPRGDATAGPIIVKF